VFFGLVGCARKVKQAKETRIEHNGEVKVEVRDELGKVDWSRRNNTLPDKSPVTMVGFHNLQNIVVLRCVSTCSIMVLRGPFVLSLTLF
jgi:hypothetical protein